MRAWAFRNATSCWNFVGSLGRMAAAIGHVGNLLRSWDVVGVLLQVAEFSKLEVLRKLDVIHSVFHSSFLLVRLSAEKLFKI